MTERIGGTGHPRLAPEQAAAANPLRSAWITANAGSGKTRVLTTRVARLLIAGVDPDRILCLTYTRAAAGEMKTRLFETLGRWAMLDDDALAAELNGLLESTESPFDTSDANALNRARRLFAKALEFPGGLRIQTIHAFGLALLQCFPLEAGLSPGIRMLNDRHTAQLALRAFEETVRHAKEDRGSLGGAYRCLVSGATEQLLQTLQQVMLENRELYRSFTERGNRPSVDAAMQAFLGTDGLSPAASVASMLGPVEKFAPGLYEIRDAMSEAGGVRDRQYAAAIDAGLSALGEGHRLHALRLLREAFFTQTSGPRQNFPSRKVKELLGANRAAKLADEYTRILDEAETARRLAAVTESSVAAAQFAAAYVDEYEAAKSAEAGLDYQDVVERARLLLADGEAGEWIRYRLDGGIEHILVDEAQDTSPSQWQTVQKLAEEFFAGESPAGGRRTLFAVGDEKQSIFSFQGADLRSFRKTREWLERHLHGAGEPLMRGELATSYRSSPAVLRFVDETFSPASFEIEGNEDTGEDPGWAETLLGMESSPRHAAFRQSAPGRVEVWDLVEPDQPKPSGGSNNGQPDREAVPADQRLAAQIARRISSWLGEGTPLPGAGRAIRPEDILVLVQRRNALPRELLRLLREAGIPATGNDQAAIRDHLAVQDCLALARFALLPEDDLTVAVVLRSPFCGISEDALFDLAWGRRGESLYSRLEKAARREPERFGVCHGFLSDMRAAAFGLGPFAFLQRALVRHDGRRRLLQRLGNDAIGPLDELVSEALEFEDREYGSLEEFVDYVERGPTELKASANVSEASVRVLTIHGAKGLEAPIVIVPDTVRTPNFAGYQRLLLAKDKTGGIMPLYVRRREDDIPVTELLRNEYSLREREESYRLFYVALTRARDWLIVAGWRGKRKPDSKSWYFRALSAANRICAPIDREDEELRKRLGAVFPGWLLEEMETGSAISRETARTPEPSATLPAWARLPAPADAAAPKWLAPSRIGEALPREASSDAAKDGESPEIGAPDQEPETTAAPALERGLLIHLLLERLPGVPPGAGRAQLASDLTGLFGGSLSPPQRTEIANIANRILCDDSLAWLFGPDSAAEAGFATALPAPHGGMTGRIDRIAFDGTRVLAVDFKSDRNLPRRPAETNDRYLAQLGAYRNALGSIYSGQRVQTAILWTGSKEPSYMEMPDDLVDDAFARALAALAAGV